VADVPPGHPDGGRSAPVGGRRWSICRHFAGVSRRHIDHRQAGSGADRPSSAADRGGSATVGQDPGQIDHRLPPTGTDRPPSRGGGAA